MLQKWCHLTVLRAAAARSGEPMRQLHPALHSLDKSIEGKLAASTSQLKASVKAFSPHLNKVSHTNLTRDLHWILCTNKLQNLHTAGKLGETQKQTVSSQN